MNKKTLYILWAVLFILCAGLGFIPESAGGVKALLLIISLCFFVPPALILYSAHQSGDRITLKFIRNLSGLSLLATLILLVLNILSALWPAVVGNILHSILTIVSAPMICSGNWFLSMFLWACLLIVSIKSLKQ